MKQRLHALQDAALGISLLYVEDDDEIRRHYGHFLENFFSDITYAKDGQEGLAFTQEREFDLIITDIVMPRMSGLEMIAAIKKANPAQVVLFVSAYSDTAMLESAIGVGVDGYLFKPLDKIKSLEVLTKTVAHITLMRQNNAYKRDLESLVAQKTQELLQTFSRDKVSGLYSLSKLQQDLLLEEKQSIAICKLQGFKAINDIYGYEAGNKLLVATANILNATLQRHFSHERCAIYRTSGTHFVILAKESSKQLFEVMVEAAQEFEAQEILIENDRLFVEMYAAVVDDRCETSLSNADRALREAEDQKSVILYSRDSLQEEQRKERIKCKERLYQAIKTGAILPYYQSIISNETNEVIKFEALARMVLPDGEVIPPMHFLPVAKESKLYHNITHAMIEQVFRDFRDLPYAVSINLSMIDIQNKKTQEFIFESLHNFPDPSRIVFEILESEEMHSYRELQEFISALQKVGAKVAIDDFGSGYSNFSYLSKLNVDYVKIDGSLIKELPTSFASKAIVQMLSNFASQMGIKTIAEFVSTQEIDSMVKLLHLDESQGYLYSQPLPLQEALSHLKH